MTLSAADTTSTTRGMRTARKARVGLSALVALVVVLSSQPVLAQVHNTRRSITGTFTMISGDPQGPTAHRYVFGVTDDDGQHHRLRISESVGRTAGGVTNLTGRRVTVIGTASATSPTGGLSEIEVSGLDVVDGTMATPQALAGPQKFVTILCRFADSTEVTPQTVPYIEGLLGDAYPGISHFWRENSYDQISNTGSIVKGWYDLPQPRSYYVSGSLNLGRAASDCTALADPTVDFNGYVGINLVFNQVLDCCAWGGRWVLTLDGTTKAWPMTWMPPWGVADQAVLGHEMGHAYGLPHSSGDYGGVYDSYWDVMSWGGRAIGTPDPTYGRLGTHTISHHKDKLGWIPVARKYEAAANSCQVITIDLQAQVPATTGTYLMARIPITAERFYTVEARKNSGYDDTRIPDEAIVIHDVLTTREESAHVVDSTINGNPNDEGAMWRPGETFTDAANGVEIAVIATTSDGWSVRITRGTETCPVPGRFNPLVPARLLDTRDGTGAPTGVVGAGATLDLQITGAGGVPASGVTAVVLNVTALSPTSASFLTAWPTGRPRPGVSNLLYKAGENVPNLVVVRVGTAGKVSLYNHAGTTHLTADVAGWYSDELATTGSRYIPLTPARTLDTRNGTGAPAGVVGAGATLDLQVTGSGGVPASGVTAVVLNVTALSPTSASFLTAWPAGLTRPAVSNLLYGPGQNVPNLVVVKVGTGGTVSLYNHAGTTHLTADVAGWYGPDVATTGARYNALTPSRVLDTRSGAGAPAAVVGPAATLDLQVTGVGSVPASGVSAVVLNVTALGPTDASFLTAWPAGLTRPAVSNLLYGPGQNVPNLVVVKVGTGGKVSLYNHAGSTNLTADVAGWFNSE